MKRNITIVLLVGLALSLGNICFAQYIGKYGDTVYCDSLLTKPDTTIALYSSGEIIFNIIRPLGKIGLISNVTQIYNTFNASKPQKGQYEKTEVFVKRLNLFKAKFKKKYIIDVEVEKKYDADNDRIRIELRDFSSYLNIKYSSQYLGLCIGQNAFGVKRKIATYKDTYYHLNVGDMSNVALGENNDNGSVSNSVPAMYSALIIENIKPKEAKKILSSLGVAYELKNIVDTEKIKSTETATIDNPAEIMRTDNILYSKIRTLYLYNKVTKDILGKLYFQ